MGEMIVVWGAVMIGASLLAGLIAGVKNRDYSFWMAWCFVAPPLLLVLMLLPRRAGPRPRRPALDQDDDRLIF